MSAMLCSKFDLDPLRPMVLADSGRRRPCRPRPCPASSSSSSAVVSRCMLRSRSDRSSVIVASIFLDCASRAAVVFTVWTTCRTRGSAANAAIIALAYLALRSTDGAGVGAGDVRWQAPASVARHLNRRATASAHAKANAPRTRTFERDIRASMQRPFATVKGTFGSVRSPSTEQQSHRHDGPDRDDRRPEGERREPPADDAPS